MILQLQAFINDKRKTSCAYKSAKKKKRKKAFRVASKMPRDADSPREREPSLTQTDDKVFFKLLFFLYKQKKKAQQVVHVCTDGVLKKTNLTNKKITPVLSGIKKNRETSSGHRRGGKYKHTSTYKRETLSVCLSLHHGGFFNILPLSRAQARGLLTNGKGANA